MRLRISTNEEIAGFAKLVRDAYADHDIMLPPDSQVAKYAEAAEKLSAAKASGKNLADWGKEKYIEVVADVMECQRLATAIKWAREKTQFVQYLPRLLKGGIDPTEKKRTVAKDLCFELKTLEMFEAAGIPADLVEPDVVFELQGHRIVVACKSLYSLSNMENQVRKATRQIVRTDQRGLIALSIDQVVRMRELMDVEDEAEFQNRIESVAIGFAKKYDTSFARWITKRQVIGLLISLSTLTNLRREHVHASAQFVVIQNRCSEQSPYFRIIRELDRRLLNRIV